MNQKKYNKLRSEFDNWMVSNKLSNKNKPSRSSPRRNVFSYFKGIVEAINNLVEEKHEIKSLSLNNDGSTVSFLFDSFMVELANTSISKIEIGNKGIPLGILEVDDGQKRVVLSPRLGYERSVDLWYMELDCIVNLPKLNIVAPAFFDYSVALEDFDPSKTVAEVLLESLNMVGVISGVLSTRRNDIIVFEFNAEKNAEENAEKNNEKENNVREDGVLVVVIKEPGFFSFKDSTIHYYLSDYLPYLSMFFVSRLREGDEVVDRIVVAGLPYIYNPTMLTMTVDRELLIGFNSSQVRIEDIVGEDMNYLSAKEMREIEEFLEEINRAPPYIKAYLQGIEGRISLELGGYGYEVYSDGFFDGFTFSPPSTQNGLSTFVVEYYSTILKLREIVEGIE